MNILCLVFRLTVLVVLCAGLSSCEKQTTPTNPAPASNATSNRVFSVRGQVVEIKTNQSQAVVRHEEIPGYMEAMTMSFKARDAAELAQLQPGDSILFSLVVTDQDHWIEKIRKLNTSPLELPSRETFRKVRDVDPVEIGQPLPDYPFTNQMGKGIRLSDFKGKALAITFIFTRCPIPNFCPRMSENFYAVQEKLKNLPTAPTNWHLISLSFDPERDTPNILQQYGKRYKHDPDRWSLLTGAFIDIMALTEQFGQVFWTQGESISHNLKTVVVDATGRVQRIFPDNEWKPEELAEEMIKAAKTSSP